MTTRFKSVVLRKQSKEDGSIGEIVVTTGLDVPVTIRPNKDGGLSITWYRSGSKRHGGILAMHLFPLRPSRCPGARTPGHWACFGCLYSKGDETCTLESELAAHLAAKPKKGD